jgi:hypothetical protein
MIPYKDLGLFDIVGLTDTMFCDNPDKVGTDVTTVSESVTTTAQLSASDSATVTEVVSHLSKTLGDTVTVTDAVASLQPRSITDGITVTEILAPARELWGSVTFVGAGSLSAAVRVETILVSRIPRTSRRIWFTFEKLDFTPDFSPGMGVLKSNWTYVEDVSEYFVRNEGEISMDVDRDMKFMVSLRLRQAEETVLNPLGDWIRPIWHSEEGYTQVERALGIFYVSFPTREYSDRETIWSLECKDPSVLLIEAAFTEPYVVAAGADPIATAIGIVREVGLVQFNVEPNSTGKTLTYPMAWDIGTPKFQVVSELLGSLNYYPPWFDAVGNFTSKRRLSLSATAPMVRYQTGEASVVVNDTISIETDTSGFANEIVIINSNPDAPEPIWARVVNDDPSSPTSTVSMERTITRVLQASFILDNEEARELAYNQLEAAASVYLTGGLSTRLDANRAGKVHEVYELLIQRNGTALIEGNWWARGWTMPLRPGGKMQHTIGKIQELNLTPYTLTATIHMVESIDVNDVIRAFPPRVTDAIEVTDAVVRSS